MSKGENLWKSVQAASEGCPPHASGYGLDDITNGWTRDVADWGIPAAMKKAFEMIGKEIPTVGERV